jgi:hypothetical protein
LLILSKVRFLLHCIMFSLWTFNWTDDCRNNTNHILFFKIELLAEVHILKVVTHCVQKSCTPYTFWKWVLYINVIRSSGHNSKSHRNSFCFVSWKICDLWLTLFLESLILLYSFELITSSLYWVWKTINFLL